MRFFIALIVLLSVGLAHAEVADDIGCKPNKVGIKTDPDALLDHYINRENQGEFDQQTNSPWLKSASWCFNQEGVTTVYFTGRKPSIKKRFISPSVQVIYLDYDLLGSVNPRPDENPRQFDTSGPKSFRRVVFLRKGSAGWSIDADDENIVVRDATSGAKQYAPFDKDSKRLLELLKPST